MESGAGPRPTRQLNNWHEDTSTMTVVLDNTDLSRTARFAKFLREAVAVKTKRVLEVQKYPHVVWFGDFPADLQEIRSPLLQEKWPATDSAWLKVARVQEPARPAAPKACAPWLVGVDLDSPQAGPALNPTYADRDEKDELVDIPVSADAASAWESYQAREWSDWAAKATVARRVKPVYQKLFSMREQVKDSADAFDLFVGVGLFDSKVDEDNRFRRHLLAFPAELALDPTSGVLALGPSADFTTARIETDFLTATVRARLQAQIDAVQPDLEALGAGVQDQNAIGDVLKRLANSVSASVQYAPNMKPADARNGAATVSFGAALILRPRSTRSMEALLEKIQKAASGAESTHPQSSLPSPWRKMTEDDGPLWEQSRPSDETSIRGGGTSIGEIYFPLPTNDEQLRIVQKANGTPGVVVQGPPGTGKSHTIANLISHYLAEGRRVLVTAQTAQALRVLRDKMPPELQELCITLLGDSRTSDRDLRRSVNGILHRRQDFSPKHDEQEIAGLESALLTSRTRLNQLEQTLHQARAAETESLEPEVGYRGTRAAIARRLRHEREQFAWIPDRIRHRAPLPTYTDGWDALAAYHASLDADTRAHLALEVVDVPFSDAEARASVQAVTTARHNLAAAPGSSKASAVPADSTQADLVAAADWLDALARAETGVTPADREWTAALRKVLLRNVAQWEALRVECRSALQPLTDAVVEATIKVDVTGRSQAEARAALAKLEKHYAEGGARRNMLGMRRAVVKENDWVEEAVTVEGAPIRSAGEVTRARQALDGWALLEAAWAPWQEWKRTAARTPRAQVSALQARSLLLHTFLDAAAIAQPASMSMNQWLVQSLDAEVATSDPLAAIRRKRCELKLTDAAAVRDGLVLSLSRAIGSREVVPSLRAMLAALTAEDLDALQRAQSELQEEILAREQHGRYLDFIEACRKEAPLLTAEIIAAEGTTLFAEKFREFVDAWGHHGVRDWLATILSGERIEAMHRAARDERQSQQDILASLTSAKAWLAALHRIDDRQRAVLTGWEQAVRAIPATGPNVFRRRAHAQRLLAGCLSSIPAWVVSLGRLYETVDPQPGLFDVAIVDEASQCWLDSLVLFYLAKQVIIVGDDKQITPTVVGVAEEEIEALARTYLPDFQFRSSFTLTSSLFDHGRRYLSDAVPLREHFRCVPEIITFSNRLCYAERPLIPLRQVGANRLEPLKRTYVPDGLRAGDINDVEAHVLVEAIAACHEDPAYDDAEFGVICLQGEAQGEHIEHMLVERLGTEAYAARNLRCGNPYVFQGDERDVMFLSMMVASNQRHASLTAAMYEQRFNVAMSRARDQAWLFHSVQEDELGANCLRRRVLDYFKNPPADTISGTTFDIHHLALLAERADRMEERAPKPFDSWFEVDVALALAARGYRIAAQVQVATKFIDLVVEGEDGLRLAVECDGEAWHGAERYAEDVARQRQLERAGWRFVRVRESLFYSNEAAAIAEVVTGCEEMDLYPAGTSRRTEREPLPAQPAQPGVSSRPAFAYPPARPAQPALPHSGVTPLLDEGGEEEAEPVEGPDEDDLTDIVDESNDDDGPERGAERSGADVESEPREYPDPKTAPAANIQAAVLDIVSRYGPLTKALIYEQYRDGCPKVARAAKSLRQAVNAALSKLERAGTVEWRDEGTSRLVADVLYRLPEQAWVTPRRTWKRDIDRVPLSELAADVIAAGGHQMAHDAEQLAELLKGIAKRYGVVRFRDQARERLWASAELARDDERSGRLGLR